MTRATSRRTPLAAATITHLHRTPRFAPLLTPPPHNERSIHSHNDNDNNIDALVHVVAVKISQQHLTQPRCYVSLRLFWDDMDNCGKCLDYSYGGPRPDRELFHPWRKKSPAAIEAEQQLKEDKHPTKKHARAQKVTRPLTQMKQLSSTFRTVGWTGPIPNAVPRSSKRQPQYSTHTILRQSRIAATTITHTHVLWRGSPDCSIPSPTSTRQRAFVHKPHALWRSRNDDYINACMQTDKFFFTFVDIGHSSTSVAVVAP
ncbi:hypothetical protein BU15DRAFT_82609 [Melanogaster broomeanus]|nr:hypothetical protein BU15DRAFT_82609 [Melanogaster broomeanus]